MLALAEGGPSMVMRDAIWTFCNALLGCEIDQCKKFFDKYQDDLIYVLCDKLRPIANDHVGLFPDVMAVFHKRIAIKTRCSKLGPPMQAAHCQCALFYLQALDLETIA